MVTQVDHCCFIINSIDPYCWDINHILALPSGFSYRNRWRHKWIEPSLIDNIQSLVSQRVLLILRDYNKDRLIPVRWGRISFAQRIGQVFYFEYDLENLVDYNADPAARTAEIDAFNRTFVERHPNMQRAKDADIAPSVFISRVGSGLRTAPDTDLDKWGSMVSAVGEVDAYKDVEFLKIVDLSSAQRQRVAVKKAKYELKPNLVYEMRIFQLVPNPSSEVQPHDIELKTLADQILILRGQQRAVGRYDMLRFIFKVQDVRPGETSFVEVSHIPHPTRGASAIPSMYLPVAIKSQPRISYIIRLLATIVTLVFTFSPDLFGVLSVAPETIRSIAIILFILLVIGWRRIWQTFWPT